MKETDIYRLYIPEHFSLLWETQFLKELLNYLPRHSKTYPSITKSTIERIAHLSSQIFQNTPSFTRNTTPKRIQTFQNIPSITKNTTPKRIALPIFHTFWNILSHTKSTVPESITHPSTSIFPLLNPSHFQSCSDYKEQDIGAVSIRKSFFFKRNPE